MSEVEVFLQENLWTLYSIFLGLFFSYILYNFFKGRGKVFVRVKTPLGEKGYWKKPVETERGMEVVMKKADKRNIGWSFMFTNKSLIPKKRLFGLIGYFAVDIFPNAKKAIEYDFENADVKMPLLTQQQAGEINRLDAFKRRYGKVEQPKSTMVQWIILIVVVIVLILNFLQMRGIRIV
jgi:hypothetical protein